MATFSATDAGLAGFKLAREHPAAIPAWAVLGLVNTLVTLGILVSMAGPALMEFQTMGADPSEVDPQQMLQLYAKLGPAYLVIIAISVIFTGILNASAARLVLRPGDKGLGYLKFGGDELRQMLLALLVILITFGLTLVAILAVGLLAGVGAVIHPAVGALLAVLGAIALFCGLIFVIVRLSLASPITFATGRIGLTESWRMTAGHFWNLVGAFLLAGVMGTIVSLLGMAIIFVVILLLFGFKNAGGAMSPDMTSMATLFTPPTILYYALMSLISALAYLIFLGAGPTIYRALTSEPEVFD